MNKPQSEQYTVVYLPSVEFNVTLNFTAVYEAYVEASTTDEAIDEATASLLNKNPHLYDMTVASTRINSVVEYPGYIEYHITLNITAVYKEQVSASTTDEAINEALTCLCNDNPYLGYVEISSTKINSISP